MIDAIDVNATTHDLFLNSSNAAAIQPRKMAKDNLSWIWIAASRCRIDYMYMTRHMDLLRPKSPTTKKVHKFWCRRRAFWGLRPKKYIVPIVPIAEHVPFDFRMKKPWAASEVWFCVEATGAFMRLRRSQHGRRLRKSRKSPSGSTFFGVLVSSSRY